MSYEFGNEFIMKDSDTVLFRTGKYGDDWPTLRAILDSMRPQSFSNSVNSFKGMATNLPRFVDYELGKLSVGNSKHYLELIRGQIKRIEHPNPKLNENGYRLWHKADYVVFSHHTPIAVRTLATGAGMFKWWIPEVGYSKTTSRLQSLVIQALENAKHWTNEFDFTDYTKL